MDGRGEKLNQWLIEHILPNEGLLRARIFSWCLPADIDVDDIMQETYAKLAVLDTVDNIEFPMAYFLQAARSVLMSHFRRSRRVETKAIDEGEWLEIADDSPLPDKQVSDAQQLTILSRAVSEMSEPIQSAFVLRFVHERSHREIGERLKISENAVQKMLARSLSALAHSIGRCEHKPQVAPGYGAARYQKK